MIPGRLAVASDDDLLRMNQAARRILAEVGMRVHSEKILRFCADAGARVDHQARTAKFPGKLIDELTPLARRAAGEGSSPRRSGFQPDSGSDTTFGSVDFIGEEDDDDEAGTPTGVDVGDEFRSSYGEVCFFLHDHDTGRRREVTSDECAELVRLGDAIPEVRSIATPVCPTDVPAVLEALHSAVLMMRNTAKTCGGGIRLPEQVPYFLDFSRIWEAHTGQKNRFLQMGGCLTTPLTLGERTAGIVDHLIDAGYRTFRFASMPIAGGNAPVTVAGCATLTVAELLGGWLVARCMDPANPQPGQVISGSMDMATGKACFASPEALLQDAITFRFFHRLYGVRIGVEGKASYIEANVPGIEATFERIAKQMATAALCGRIGFHLGSLDGAAIFSREQAMLDLETGRALWRLYHGADFSDEALALEEILREGHRGNFFASEHTLRHFREAWLPRIMRREMLDDAMGEMRSDAHLLDRARDRWQALLADHEPTSHDPALIDDLQAVVDRARRELTG